MKLARVAVLGVAVGAGLVAALIAMNLSSRPPAPAPEPVANSTMAPAVPMEQVLVGEERGVLAPGTPRSGLRPAVEALAAELRLPLAGEKARDMRLDSLRSDLDRRREVALRQLEVCRVPYGERVAVEGAGGTDALTTRWTVQWVPGTEAMLELAGIRGVTLAQAAEGTLRHRRRVEQDDNGPTSAQLIDGLAVAAGCGLVALTRERVAEVATEVPAADPVFVAEVRLRMSRLQALWRDRFPLDGQ